MGSDFSDAFARATRATSIAKRMDSWDKRTDQKRTSRPMIQRMNITDIGPPEIQEKKDDDWATLDLKLSVISTLHNIKKMTFGQIDALLRFPKSTSAHLAKQYPEKIQLFFREDCDNVLDQFYRNKISILENLMVGAVNTVQHLRSVQNDEEATTDQRLKAGDRIYDWTRLILTTKTPERVKKVLGEDLRKVSDEADAVEQMLCDVIGGMSGDGPEEN